MFNECSKLQNIDLSSFNTQNVKSMKGIFWLSFKLKNIDLSSFNIQNVTNLECILINFLI